MSSLPTISNQHCLLPQKGKYDGSSFRYRIAFVSWTTMVDNPLTGLSDLYILGLVLPISLGLLACSFSSKQVRSVRVKGIDPTLISSEFPDYAALSGVPLPKPLNNFDIDKAKPRPYRPFRWKYIQNMGMSFGNITIFLILR
jgi:hypothetical protein